VVSTAERAATPRWEEGEMPAETIYTEANDVRVAWGSGFTETLQVTVKVPRRRDEDDPTRQIISIVNDWLVNAGESKIDLDELNTKLVLNGHPKAFFDGYTAQISNWASVNRLIGVLQRARDKVFGEPA
jgi:hypothetical protein